MVNCCIFFGWRTLRPRVLHRLNIGSTTGLHCQLPSLLPLGTHRCDCIHAHSWSTHPIPGWPGPKVGANFCSNSEQLACSLCEEDDGGWACVLSLWVKTFLPINQVSFAQSNNGVDLVVTVWLHGHLCFILSDVSQCRFCLQVTQAAPQHHFLLCLILMRIWETLARMLGAVGERVCWLGEAYTWGWAKDMQ